MKILALECSASAASAAILEDEKILAEFFINVKLTHSQTLMPMVEGAFKSTAISVEEIDGFAIASGPGSFTGVRIGVSALKGMAWPLDKPCAGVSTLAAMAENMRSRDCIVCCVMDARCNQVYNAVFLSSENRLTRLCEDRAILMDELTESLKMINSEYKDLPIVLVGDGAELYYDNSDIIKQMAELAPGHLRYQRAAGVGAAALPLFKAGKVCTAEELMPFYLRLPQAERELKRKSNH